MTKQFCAAIIATFMSVSLAHAENDCEKQAADKKLSGAAKMSFLAKCERNAGASAAEGAEKECEKQAIDKKLSGAAKASFVKKCAKDGATK